MRAVIDTNVLLSGLLWRGHPHALLEHVRAGTLALVSSPALLAELTEVIGRAKFDAILTHSNTSLRRSLAWVRQLAEAVDPPLAAQVEMIVSGDDDLLVLGNFNGIPVINAAEALWRIDGSFAVTAAELPTG